MNSRRVDAPLLIGKMSYVIIKKGADNGTETADLVNMMADPDYKVFTF